MKCLVRCFGTWIAVCDPGYTLNWDTSKTLLAAYLSKHETFYHEVLGSKILGLFSRHETRQIQGWIFAVNNGRKVAWSAPVT